MLSWYNSFYWKEDSQSHKTYSLERCQSGRMGYPGKVVYRKRYRGFESLPLRRERSERRGGACPSTLRGGFEGRSDVSPAGETASPCPDFSERRRGKSRGRNSLPLRQIGNFEPKQNKGILNIKIHVKTLGRKSQRIL